MEKERYADKIAALLRKAENPAATPAEAEAFIAKAQELMTKYAIDEALLAKARGDEIVEKIVEQNIILTGVYHSALYDIAAAIARAQDCKVLISRGSKSTTCHVIGFESDVKRTKMLNASVQIQAVGALGKWWRDQDTGWMSAMQKYKDRREFLFGYSRGLSTQLVAAKKAGERAAAEAEAERHTGVDAEREAVESVALVIRSKKARVDDWVDQSYGKLRRSARRYSSGGYGAMMAGSDAGRRADVSGSGTVAGGSAGALNA